MAKNLLTNYNCKVCGKEHNSVSAFTQHIQSEHNITKSDYTVKYLLNGVIPTCVCGCEKTVKVNGYKVNESYIGHSGGGNWQTKYDKDSEEYKNVVAKISKSVKEYTTSNPPVFSKETKEKRSKYMKDLLSNPEERENRRIKMQETKRKQSEDGTLSRDHFTKIRAKEDVKHIYSNIADKASKTKMQRYTTGELVPWNKGKNKIIDDRIKKIAGENHYRFNPNKEIPYTENFYNTEYRSFILEKQDGKCFKCNEEVKSMCLHHVDENKKNDSFENLIFVCRSCHSKIHNNRETQILFDEEVKKFKQNIIL